MRFWNDVFVLVAFLWLPGIAYSWYDVLKTRSTKRMWRDRFSFVTVAFITLLIALWPVMWGLSPSANWTTGQGVGEKVHFVNLWTGVTYLAALLAVLLSVLCRPRLTIPLAIAAISIAFFFTGTTVP